MDLVTSTLPLPIGVEQGKGRLPRDMLANRKAGLRTRARSTLIETYELAGTALGGA